MGREEAGNPELELLSQGPYRVGLPQGTPVPKALGLASPLPSHWKEAQLGNTGFSATAQGAGCLVHHG